MKTLIIPCAGKSTRFPGMRPKWLLTHPNGELMIQSAIKGIDIMGFDRVIITIVKEHDIKYEAKLILDQCFDGLNFEVLVLDDFTSCAAETIYLTLTQKKVEGQFLVKDSDNFTKIDFDFSDFNIVVGLDVTKRTDVTRLGAKSFLIVNEQGQIVDIIEKQIRSNIICLGVYGFESAQKFMEAYLFILDNKFIKGEIYLSHVISYLIGTKETYYTYIEASGYEDWGTLQDWRKIQKKNRTYFVDIDGVLIKNSGKYGIVNWSNNRQLLEENVQVLKQLSESGNQIIFTTSRGEDYRQFLTSLIETTGIKTHSLVMGCLHSSRVIINDFANSNPYPSCVSISLPRNETLKQYLEIETDK